MKKFRGKPVLIIFGAALIGLIVLCWPVPASQINYALNQPELGDTGIAGVPQGPVPAVSSITIPKLNVYAPIIYEPSNDENAIQEALEGGVIHYAGTALPGQVGNVAIFGHSSNDWWDEGDYKFVFVLLDRLVPGDTIVVDYKSVRYNYVVTGSRIVAPDEVSVLDPTPSATLSLITCTPPGTSLKRLVVTAKQLPVQAPETVVAQGGKITEVPEAKVDVEVKKLSSSDGIMTKIWGFVNGVVNLVIPATADTQVGSPEVPPPGFPEP